MSLPDRNKKYDLLRFIGISCIILAHMGAPGVIFQLRNFDVPLMVLLSGINYSQFSSTHYSSYLNYIYSRFIRLVFPTWIFLAILNCIVFFTNNNIPSLHNILYQLTLISDSSVGMGIWIIRIFVSIAIIAPCLYWTNSLLKTKKSFYYFTAIIYILYEILHLAAVQFLPTVATFTSGFRRSQHYSYS